MILFETLENRRMLSTTSLTVEVPQEEVALLLPAVQVAREAPKTSTATTGRTGPIIDVLYSAAGNSADAAVWPGRTGPTSDTLSSAGGNSAEGFVQLQLVVM